MPISTRAYAGAYAYPAPRSPPAASRTTPWVWAADPQDPLALGDLRGYAVPQLAVGLDLAAAEAEALDLDQAAPDGPLRGVEVEEGQAGPLEAHLAAQRVAVSLRAGVQFEVGVQGDHRLVAEGLLVPQVGPGQAQRLGPLRRRGYELEGRPPGERPQVVQEGKGVAVVRRQAGKEAIWSADR